VQLETFFEKFELFADAPGAVAKMRNLLIRLGVNGKLATNDSRDRPVSLPLSYASPCDQGLPSNWRCGLIGDAFIFEYGDNLPAPKRTETGEFPVYGSNGIVGTHDAYLTQHPAIIVGRKGSAGALNIATGPSWTTDVAYFVRPPNDLDLRFTYYLFTTLRLGDLGKGIKPGLSRKEAYALPIALPPLAEQKRIVAKVDELMALCDRLETQQAEREARHAALARASLARFADAPTPANLDFVFHKSYDIAPADLRKAILTLAVQGKLVEADLAAQPADELLVQMMQRRQELIDSKKIRKPRDLPAVTEEEKPFSVPASWRWARWGHICDWITYGFTRPMAHVEKGPPIVTAKNVQDGYMTFESAHCAEAHEFGELNPKDLPRKGDILITKDGTIGRAAIVETDVPFCINQSVAVLWLESCLLYRPFMLMVIRSPFAQGPIWEAAEGMAIKHLSITDFGQMILPVPPLAEQRRIVAKVEQLMALVDELESQLSASRSEAERLLDAIVAELAALQ